MENDYIIGAEKSLKDIIKDNDLISLFRCAVDAGVSEVTMEDSKGEVLYRYGDSSGRDISVKKYPVYLEGEIAGHIVIKGDKNSDGIVETIGEAIFNAVKIIIKSSFKTMLATESHKTIVHQSYEELLESNSKLKLSEKKYRDLANSLEKQVQERTEELKQAHAKLLQQEKIASVGQLAAGVAHEINNPLGFISSNISTMKDYVSIFKEMLEHYSDVLEKADLTDSDREAAREKWRKNELDYILSDIEDLIKETLDGAERVKKIVSDLKGFSHIDDGDKSEIDINREIDRTLNVLTHEIPEDAEIVKDYQSLPGFICNPAHICQAFLNIILNSLQTGKRDLKLIIKTLYSGGSIRVVFSDNGPGIPENIKNRIFDPFFTTKDVGKGTGMGLNVTYEIITSYGGTVEVESRPGKGTEFSILLPLTEKEKDV